MSKRLFAGVFLLVSLCFIAGESYACPILKAIIYPAEPVPKLTWVHVGNATSFDGSYSVGSIVNCTWSLPGAYDIHYSTVRYPNDHVICRFSAVGQYTVTLRVIDNQGRTDTDTCTVYVVSIGIGTNESSYIAVNNDDDNENGIMDMGEETKVTNEDTQPYDLRKILLYVQTPKLSDKVLLGVGPELSCGNMKIWSHRDKQNRVVPPPGSSDCSAKLPAWSSTEPHEFYVEALYSWTPGEPYVRLCYMAVDERTTPPTEWVFPPREPEAQINFTLLEVDVDIEGVKDDYRQGSATEETIPGGFIPLNGLVRIDLNPLLHTQLPINAGHPVTLKAISGGEKIRIWDNENKTGTPITLPKPYTSRWTDPIHLWVEGIELSSVPRDITLALEYAGFEDRIRGTVTKVDRIQYLDPVSGYTDIYGTLYVNIGTTVTFKAIPNPSGASWPSGKPVWGGISGASGTGETREVTFNTLSSTLSDYKTVTAECGNTVTVNVIVYDYQGTFVPEDDFDGRSQACYGIEEKVDLGCDITPCGLTASQIGGLQWALLDGVGELDVDPWYGTAGYDAEASAGDVTFVLVVMSGPSMGAGFFNPYNRTVVAPADAYIIVKPGTGIWHRQGFGSVGFKAWIYLLPQNVSFKNIKFSEGTCPSIKTGFYIGKPPNEHQQSEWQPVGMGNISTGCRVLADDTIDQIYGGPFSYGTFTWVIPWKYLGDTGGGTEFTTATQMSTMYESGTATIAKKGVGPFAKGLDDPNSDY